MSFIISNAVVKGTKCGENRSPLSYRFIDLPPLYDPATDTGYYGVVTASQLFTGAELSTTLGITAGSLQNSETDWLHFYVGKNAACNRDPRKRPYEIYIAKKSIRHTIAWEDMNKVGAVYGTRVVTNNGKSLICRLPTGADNDPSGDANTNKSEWNALMYRVHTIVPDNQVGDNWATFSDIDTNVKNGNGSFSWCQEWYDRDTNDAIVRGNISLDFIQGATSDYTYTSAYGWRPVLVSF